MPEDLPILQTRKPRLRVGVTHLAQAGTLKLGGTGPQPGPLQSPDGCWEPALAISLEPLGRVGLWSCSPSRVRDPLLPQLLADQSAWLAPIKLCPHPLHVQSPASSPQPPGAPRTWSLGSTSSCTSSPTPRSSQPCSEAAPGHGHPNVSVSSCLLPELSALHRSWGPVLL